MDARLALRLLYERAAGAASPWHSYLQLLPDSIPNGRHLGSAALRGSGSASLYEQAEQIRKGWLQAFAAWNHIASSDDNR